MILIGVTPLTGAPMKTQVMDLLQYLFERMQDQVVVTLGKNQALVDELKQVGFSHKEIEVALKWLDGLVDASSTDFAPLIDEPHTRIYHPFEMQALSTECRGFIYFLEQMGVLDSHSREAVIDRALALDVGDSIDLDQLKWVIGMVLFNIPGKEEAAIWLENIDACIH